MDASNVFHTTKKDVGHKLWGVYQQSYWVSRGRVCYNKVPCNLFKILLIGFFLCVLGLYCTCNCTRTCTSAISQPESASFCLQWSIVDYSILICQKVNLGIFDVWRWGVDNQIRYPWIQAWGVTSYLSTESERLMLGDDK